MSAAYRQMKRVLVRASRRPLATLELALVIGAGAFAWQSRLPPNYEAEFELPIEQLALSADGRPLSPTEGQAVLDDLLFSDARLDALIGKYDLVARIGAGSREAAREALRRRLRVGIDADNSSGELTSSAGSNARRVTTGFSASTPDLAMALARDSGQVVADAEVARLSQDLSKRIGSTRQTAATAVSSVVNIENQLQQATKDAAIQPRTTTAETVAQLSAALQAAQRDAQGATARLVDLQIVAQKTQQSHIPIRIAKLRAPLLTTTSRPARLAIQAGLSLLVASIAAVLLVGTLDPTIWDQQDIRRARLTLLARLPVSSQQSSRSRI